MNEIIAFHSFPAGQLVEVVLGDLTEERVDAIVNAANAHLLHGGGVAAAIVRRGGRAIEEESLAWVKHHGPVSHGEPAYTSAGDLPCRFVIHAVGPVWGSGEEDEKLTQTITGSIKLAEALQATSIAIPPISTGIFGFPKDRAARVIMLAIKEHYQTFPSSPLQKIRITIIDRGTLNIFLHAFEHIFPKK